MVGHDLGRVHGRAMPVRCGGNTHGVPRTGEHMPRAGEKGGGAPWLVATRETDLLASQRITMLLPDVLVESTLILELGAGGAHYAIPCLLIGWRVPPDSGGASSGS